MKIALVCCPTWGPFNPPLSITTLQAFLKQNKYEVVPFDFNISFYNSYRIRYTILKSLFYHYGKGFTKLFYTINLINKRVYDSYIKKIIESGADVICFTAYRSNGLTSMYMANRIKMIDSKKIIIFGGPFCFSKTIREHLVRLGSVDAVIVGEGEVLLLKQLERIKRGCFQKKECVIEEATKHDLLDINKEPIPDFEGLQLNKYTTNHISYATSRGCTYKCVYCTESRFWQVYRFKSAKKVFKDLKKLKKKCKTNRFHFADSIINSNRNELEKICDLLIKNKLNIMWYGQARCKNLDEKLLKKMKKAGCMWLIYGVESGSQRILDSMKKGYDINEIEKVIRMTDARGIKVWANFIVGYPTETWSDFYKTVNFVYKNRKFLSIVRVSFLGIAKESGFYSQGNDYNITKKDSIFWHSKNSTFLTRFIRFIILKNAVKILVKNSKKNQQTFFKENKWNSQKEST